MMALAVLQSVHEALTQASRRLARVKLPSWRELSSRASDALRDGSRFF